MIDGVTPGPDQPILRTLGARAAALTVDLDLYALPALFRAAYKFTGRCYVFLARETEKSVTVTLGSKVEDGDIGALAGDFCNELVDQQVREQLAAEAGPVRELIVAQAFAEGNLLSTDREDGDYGSDPLGIGRPDDQR